LALTIPILFVNATAKKVRFSVLVTHKSILTRDFVNQWKASSEFEMTSPAMQITRGLTLFFAIPETFATLPRVPWPTSQSRVRLRRLLSSQIVPRSLLIGIATLASFLPPSVTSVLTSVALVLILLSTYMLPTVFHILFHHIFRPTSIVLPRTRFYHVTTPQEAEEEESAARLLNAKERKLQRKRLLRRLSWDILAWSVVAGSVLWIVGRIAHWWWWM
jgi:hypothetical protein